MVPEHCLSTSAAASLERLRRYQRCWEVLIERGLSRDQFRLMDEELVALQHHLSLFPLLAADFAELLMRHAQLLRSLMKPGDDARRLAEVQALGRKHRMSIEALCDRLVGCIDSA